MIRSFRAARIAGTAAIAASALTFLPTFACAATDFTKVIPNDALLAVWANDATALKDGANASPYGKFWADPASEKLRNWADGKFKELESELKTGEDIKPSDILNLVKGGVGFFLVPVGDKIDEENLSAQAIVEVDEAGKAWLQEKVKTLGANYKDLKKDSYETNGVTVFKLTGTKPSDEAAPTSDATGEATPAASEPGESETVSYAFVDNYFLISIGSQSFDDAVKATVNSLKAQDSATTLGKRDDARTFSSAVPTSSSQFNFFFDIGRAVNSGLKESADPNDPESAAIQQSIPGTGLLDLKSLYGTVTVGATGVTSDVAIVVPPEKNGVVKAFYSAGPTPLKMLSLAPADSNSVSSFSFDLGLFYDAVMKIANEMNPMIAGIAQMQVANIQGQYGVDVLNGILKNVGGEHLVVSRDLDPELAKGLEPELQKIQTSTAVFLGLKNGDETVANLKTLVDNLKKDPNFGQAIKTEEKDGVTSVSIETPGDTSPLKPGFAFTKQALVISNNSVELQEAIRSLAGKGTSPITESAELKKAITGLDNGSLTMFQFTPRKAIAKSLTTLKEVLVNSPLGDELGEDFNADLIPDGAVASKYFGDSVTTLNLKDNVVHLHSVVGAAN